MSTLGHHILMWTHAVLMWTQGIHIRTACVFIRVVNIGCRSIAPILFQYRSRYRQYLPAQASHAESAILFWSKIQYLSDTFLLKIIFFRLDSFFRFSHQSMVPATASWYIIIVKGCNAIFIVKMIVNVK